MKYVLLGLGNKDKYGTRHNIGKDFIEEFVKQSSEKWIDRKKYKFASVRVGSNTILCVVTNGFMNNSGNDTKELLKEINEDRLVVIYDDLDLDVGTIKLTKTKGDGGHKGVSDIIRVLGTKNFYKLRIGIGHPRDYTKETVNEYVLGEFDKYQLEKIISELRKKLPEVFFCLFQDNTSEALKKCNTK